MDEAQDPSAQAQPFGSSPTPAQSEPLLLSVGEIGVSKSWVVTPTGNGPLKGAQWILRDMTRQEQKTPQWAIVVGIVLGLLTCVGFLLLLIKETRIGGTMDVVVTTGSLTYATQIPVRSSFDVDRVRQQVLQAQNLSAAA